MREHAIHADETNGPSPGLREQPLLSRKAKFLFGASVIVLAVATLIYSAVRETSSYFITVEEYAQQGGAAGHAGKQLRLAGRVAGGSVKWDPKTLDLEFVIAPIPPKEAAAHAEAHSGNDVAAPAAAPSSAAATLPVRYNGILPDMFAADRDVIVEGKVEGGVFHAKTLLTTCPSKYESDQYESEASGEPAKGDLRAALDQAPEVP